MKRPVSFCTNLIAPALCGRLPQLVHDLLRLIYIELQSHRWIRVPQWQLSNQTAQV